MSEYDRLSKGFVNWQGQRVFVPWFGAPRIVPSAAAERRVLKLRFAVEPVVAVLLVLFLVIARWLDEADVVAALEVAMATGLGVFGFAALVEQRWTRQWSHQTAARFSRSRFMLSYFRSLPVLDRIIGLGLDAVVLALCGRALYYDFLARIEPWENWLVATLSVALLALMTFFAARGAALVLLSLAPVPRRQSHFTS